MNQFNGGCRRIELFGRDAKAFSACIDQQRSNAFATVQYRVTHCLMQAFRWCVPGGQSGFEAP